MILNNIIEKREQFYEEQLIETRTRTNKKAYFYKKFKYSYKYMAGDLEFYRCTDPKCSSSLYIYENTIKRLHFNHEHDEVSLSKEYIRYFVIENLIFYSINTFLTPKEIITKILKDLEIDEKKALPSKDRLICLVNTQRKNHSMAVPNTECEIPEEYFRCPEGNKFIQIYTP